MELVSGIEKNFFRKVKSYDFSAKVESQILQLKIPIFFFHFQYQFINYVDDSQF